MENTFFDLESYENEIALDVNEDVLARIYGDGIKPTDYLPVEFFFLTDTESKAKIFADYLSVNFPDYEELRVREYGDDFEISGTTEPQKMTLESINRWNRIMWDAGYQHDCKLDGWQVGT